MKQSNFHSKYCITLKIVENQLCSKSMFNVVIGLKLLKYMVLKLKSTVYLILKILYTKLDIYSEQDNVAAFKFS